MPHERDLPFPEPTRIAGRNYWPKGAVRLWRAAMAGEPAPAVQPDDEILINSRQVRDLFGGVSDMWLWRRRQSTGPRTGESGEAA